MSLHLDFLVSPVPWIWVTQNKTPVTSTNPKPLPIKTPLPLPLLLDCFTLHLQYSTGWCQYHITCLLSYPTFPPSQRLQCRSLSLRHLILGAPVLLVGPLARCMHACSPFFYALRAPRTTSTYRRNWPMPSRLPDARRGGVVLNEVHLPAIRPSQKCFGRCERALCRNCYTVCLL